MAVRPAAAAAALTEAARGWRLAWWWRAGGRSREGCVVAEAVANSNGRRTIRMGVSSSTRASSNRYELIQIFGNRSWNRNNRVVLVDLPFRHLSNF